MIKNIIKYYLIFRLTMRYLPGVQEKTYPLCWYLASRRCVPGGRTESCFWTPFGWSTDFTDTFVSLSFVRDLNMATLMRVKKNANSNIRAEAGTTNQNSVGRQVAPKLRGSRAGWHLKFKRKRETSKRQFSKTGQKRRPPDKPPVERARFAGSCPRRGGSTLFQFERQILL